MHFRFYILFIMAVLCNLPAFGTVLYYQDTAAGEFGTVHLTGTPSGYTVESMNQHADSMIYSLDTNCATLTWRYINDQTNTALSVSRSGDMLIALGIFNGRKFSKTYKIDSNPWFQVWNLPAEVFVRSGTKSVRFWSIDPQKVDRIVRFEFTPLKPDTIQYQGVMIPVRHLQVALTGIRSAFFKGDYWLRESDYRVIRSRMPRGIGKKPTASELVKEE